jgi:steroid delta-isomerase-like uncharacterized protein
MSTEQNKAIVRRFFEEFNYATVDELLIPDYTHHDPSLPPELQRGRDAYKQVVGLFLTAFPDLKTTVEDLVAEGDEVACRWIFRGTHRGEMMGLPATGRQMVGTGMSFHRISNGKIAEGWINFDTLGMLQQLGAIPSPEQAKA